MESIVREKLLYNEGMVWDAMLFLLWRLFVASPEKATAAIEEIAGQDAQKAAMLVKAVIKAEIPMEFPLDD